MRSSSSSPDHNSPSPLSRACGFGARIASSRVMVIAAVVPLLIVSLTVFGSGSSSTTSWLSSETISTTTRAAGAATAASTTPQFSGESNQTSITTDLVSLPVADAKNVSSSSKDEEDDQEVGQVDQLNNINGVTLKVQEIDKNASFSGNNSTITEHGLIQATAPTPAPEPDATLVQESRLEDHNKWPVKTQPRDPKLEKLEYDLARARQAIREAATNGLQLEDKEYTPIGPLYLNARAFHRSYLEMEKIFKVHVYKEGEPPIFHDGPCRSVYSTEGRMIHHMEMDTVIRTRDPEQAHVHFLPYSVTRMVKLIYDRDSHNINPLKNTIADYINVISERYRFWNRSLGADHFIVACHDWGPYTSDGSKQLFYNSIRALCNANTSEGFNPLKDVSLIEILRRDDDMSRFIGGPSPSARLILAFFAGGNHGPVRPLLFEHWKDKDTEVEVHEYLPKGISYIDKMRRSKFCLCPSGYEVASPRVVEAIYAECVPVTINYNYILPHSDVLNWKSFSVQIAPEDIPNIKTILKSISPRQYIRMQRRVRMVRRHFTMNSPPQRYDAYYMTLHSIWLRRLNMRIHPKDQ